MKYTKEQRMEIGRQIYEGELTTAMAADKYDINLYTARDYLRLYKASINVAIPKQYQKSTHQDDTLKDKLTVDDYQAMSKDELIDELIKSKINEARAKKGYMVKGDGPNKEFIPISKKNSKS